MITTNDPGTNDPRQLRSWLRINDDNTVAISAGVIDYGQGSVSTNLRQIVAEELRVPFEAVTDILLGDTDRTPGGGIAAGILSKSVHEMFFGLDGTHPQSPFGRTSLNLQKAAAYAYQELLDRASRLFDVDKEELEAGNGVISWNGRSVSYAELVAEAPLELTFEIGGVADGNPGVYIVGAPPLVPMSEWRVIGKSHPNPRIPEIVKGTPTWVGDVRLEGMLHGRMVHPRTLGSTLVSVGSLDAAEFPDVEIVVRGNLVGVVASDEWDAIRGSQALAQTTVWTDWAGLPSSEWLAEEMMELDWSAAPVETVASGPDSGKQPELEPEVAVAAASQRLDSYFMLPFYKHAPIGPEVTVADARADGTTHIWTASQQFQRLRVNLAAMLETDPDNVVVHAADGAAGFGRTTGGDAGPEAEAVILSQACGRPVRLQWMRDEDFAWSRQQAPYFGEVSAGLDESGRLLAFVAKHHHAGMVENRLLGASLAGLPSPPMPDTYLTRIHTEWPYDRTGYRHESCCGAANLGQEQSEIKVGLRNRSMRSPNHLQQNFGVESMVNELAATAGADPIQYRIDMTSDPRHIRVLEKVREMSEWQTRPSPAPDARATGEGVVRGRGVGTAVRHGGYFAAVAEIAVDLSDGAVTVEKYWLAVDVGVVVNPRLLLLNLEGGTVMGISQALHEELRFGTGSITSTDFGSYPILKMAEMPQLRVEIIENREAMVVGQGSEPSNMPPPVAITGAFFDATGIFMRRLPMRPGYVLAELRDG